MRVTILPAAERDLESIADYIAQDNPSRAVTFVEELRHATDVLADYPQAFPLINGYEDYGIRFHVHGRYILFYRVLESRIAVLRVLHSSQDYTQHLTNGLGALH